MKKTAFVVSAASLAAILLAPSSADAQYYGSRTYRPVYTAPSAYTSSNAYAAPSGYSSPYAGSWAYYGSAPSGYNLGDNIMDRYPAD